MIVVNLLRKFVVTQNVLVQELFDAIALVLQPAPVQAVAGMLGPHCRSILSLCPPTLLNAAGKFPPVNTQVPCY